MKTRRTTRKPTPRRPRYENTEHRRIRLGPGAGIERFLTDPARRVV